MKIYLLWNSNNIKNLFFDEKIMAPIYYENKFYNYKRDKIDIKNGIVFYKKIPRVILKKEFYILEFEIKIRKRDYSKVGEKYIFYRNIYLNEPGVQLNKILYTSDEMYKELLIDLKLIAEAKNVDKYRKKFILLNKEKVQDLASNNCSNEKIKDIEIEDIIKIEKEKDIYYDALKGSLYLVTRFYPKILFRNKKQLQIQNDILKIKKFIKLIEKDVSELKEEKKYIKNYLEKQIKVYKEKIDKNIIKNSKIKNRKKYSIFQINKNKNIKLNLSTMANEDRDLINKIISIIVNQKKYKNKEIRQELVKKIGIYCKKTNDIQLYNDARILYGVLINRDLTKSYKDIKNNIIKLLYLALEYYDNINTLNEIIIEYKFKNYPIIYIFAGLIIGYEKLSKLYTDGYNLGSFQKEFDLQLSDIIKDLNKVYMVDSYYKKQNCILIENLLKEKNYYRLITIYCFEKRGKYNLKMVRQTREILKIYVNNKYKIQFNEYINKEEKGNKVFNLFKYSNIQGNKLSYHEEIELSAILIKISEEIRGANKEKVGYGKTNKNNRSKTSC